jgi:ribose 5-phosphate isomerase B
MVSSEPFTDDAKGRSMTSKTIAIAADHGGLALKRLLSAVLRGNGVDVADFGTEDDASVDYPDYAAKVVEALSDGRAMRGILLCGSGIGMSIAANRHPGIRAALVHDVETAVLSRKHNDANVLVMGGRLIDDETAKACLDAFLNTSFEGGRHRRRVEKMA